MEYNSEIGEGLRIEVIILIIYEILFSEQNVEIIPMARTVDT